MPGAVAIATTANTSAPSPIPNRVGQNCRILDAAVTLLVLTFLTSWIPRTLLPTRSPPAPGHARSTEMRQPWPPAQRLRLRAVPANTLPIVRRDRQLQRIPLDPAALTTNFADTQ